MKIIIVGQGAIGLLWYHHLQQLLNQDNDFKKHDIYLLSSKKSNHLKSNTKNDHYYFTDYSNSVHTGLIQYANNSSIQNADIIIMCVKSFQISSALNKFSTILKKQSSIILAHNGMGTINELPDDIINKHNIYTLLMTHGCLRTAPYSITHTGIGVSDMGLLAGVPNSEQPNSLIHLLNSALPEVSFHQDILNKQWVKLAVNCIINPITALYNIENGKTNNNEFVPLIRKLIREIIEVAASQNLLLDENTLINTVKEVAKTTEKNSSSMRCDILAKRRTEIDYINGYIHRLGIEFSVATPVNTKMWQSVKNLENNFKDGKP